MADMLGVSRQRVHQLIDERADFPEPVDTIQAGRVWWRDDIERWAKKVGRLPAT